MGWSYQDAIEYSLPPLNLLTLIFPFFFRSAGRRPVVALADLGGASSTSASCR